MNGAEMPAEHAILGLLEHDGRRGYGYDLARWFAPTRPLGLVIRLDPEMLYHHLKKMERAGWVTSTREVQGENAAGTGDGEREPGARRVLVNLVGTEVNCVDRGRQGRRDREVCVYQAMALAAEAPSVGLDLLRQDGTDHLSQRIMSGWVENERVQAGSAWVSPSAGTRGEGHEVVVHTCQFLPTTTRRSISDLIFNY
jgi:hypothetical protein